VAYILSGAVAGVLPRTQVRRSGERLQLVLPPDLADLGGPRLDSRLKQLAALRGLVPEIAVER
jgi:exopolyphosphatase/guanosine-5'-triphosphate,3'-diphosphate pyrophosphatase